LWANGGLAPREFSRPLLWLLFLRYVEAKFAATERDLSAQNKGRGTAQDRQVGFSSGGGVVAARAGLLFVSVAVGGGEVSIG
jgi:hypothetical protein